MLKALELYGFKSFADKTRFEFPEGITVIVGPNGSGKSNIVDAMKWVLGEQSAKSLRGRDMADVIFKGGGGGGRKPMNTAEATLVFDNSEKRLPLDAVEVHVTRRVYRSGEAEYLLNRQPCRLRDIKDLFRGTGVGTDAYSLIEQGKVDSLLAASAKDRRAIFEEAAGISRFKAKKVESQRRLERVAQNLLRLNDLVEEVESRLRSVRAQASKARRYQELSERLQQLRTQVGLADWRALSEKLTLLERDLAAARENIAAQNTRQQTLEQQWQESERALAVADDELRTLEAQRAQNRELIVAQQAERDHEWTRLRDLEKQVGHSREQWLVLNSRADDVAERAAKLAALLQTAELEHATLAESTGVCQRAADTSSQKCAELRGENESRRNTYMQQMRSAANFANQLATHEAQFTEAQASAERASSHVQELAAAHEAEKEQAERLNREVGELATQASTCVAAADEAQARLEQYRREAATQLEELRQLEARLRATRDRFDLLDELERQQEGLAPGAKDLLARAKSTAPAVFADVHDIVANLLEAEPALAPLIDVALGEAGQHVVVAGQRVSSELQANAGTLAGRVGVVQFDAIPKSAAAHFALTGLYGVIGRADQFIRTASQYEPLVAHLLGRTWLVENLDTALAIREGMGRGLRFVTRAGEVLEADGTLVLGPPRAHAGLVARRSELRTLREQIETLSAEAEAAQRQQQQLAARVAPQAAESRRLADDQKRVQETLAGQRAQAQASRQRCQHLNHEQTTAAANHTSALRRFESASQQVTLVRHELSLAEGLLSSLEREVREAEDRLKEIEAERQRQERLATEAKVRLAKSELALEGARLQLRQCHDDQEERARAVGQVQGTIDEQLGRATVAERAILAATSALATLVSLKESLAKQVSACGNRRKQLTLSRTQAGEELESLRRKLRKLEEEQHHLELTAGEVRHERTSLAERFRDDYEIDLSALESGEGEGDAAREQVEAEIAELRRKLHHMGAVNLEALNELESLEGRFGAISTQYQDLVKAKETLEKIIEKINIDSRRLFIETLEAVRANFQVLFRRVFGGGKADIVLEEGVDLLDAGVEIIATPPGKQSLSISLLSGGEKALTAVTLLMAIFQFRPSPFCVLDEVDGPLDEANIGRFVEVLKEFLSWTKFVIVTHSKKTMTAAHTLYGVTMQESGISKRVSVRFEDVSEDGQISRTAIESAKSEEPPQAERGVA